MISRFADPVYFLLLAVVPLLAYWSVIRGRPQVGSLRYSSLAPIIRADHRRSGRYRHTLFGLRAIALTALTKRLRASGMPWLRPGYMNSSVGTSRFLRAM